MLRLLHIKDTILKNNAANRLHLDIASSRSRNALPAGDFAYRSLPFGDTNIQLLSGKANNSVLDENSNSMLTSEAGLSILML